MRMSEGDYQALLARRLKTWENRSGLPRDAVKEDEVLKRVRSVARVHGWLCYHTYDARRSEPGFPDVVATNGRRLLFAELKSRTGKVTIEQARWLELLERATAIDVRLWRPGDAIDDYFKGA